MTKTDPQLPLREWMHSILPNVFDTMVAVPAVPAPDGSHPNPDHGGERISGAIGIIGESFAGAIYLHLSLPFASEITALLLQSPPDEPPAAADINDVVGEFCNMVSGQLKSSLANHGTPCAISPPSIIRGSSFAVESMADAHEETFHFNCLSHHLSVEIHLQPQDP